MRNISVQIDATLRVGGRASGRANEQTRVSRVNGRRLTSTPSIWPVPWPWITLTPALSTISRANARICGSTSCPIALPSGPLHPQQIDTMTNDKRCDARTASAHAKQSGHERA